MFLNEIDSDEEVEHSGNTYGAKEANKDSLSVLLDLMNPLV